MTRRHDDETFPPVLRGADSLPPALALERELAVALPRTRAAVNARARSALARSARSRSRDARRPAAPGRSAAATGGSAVATAGPVVATACLAAATGGLAAAFIVYPAPWGPLHIAAGDGGLVSIELRTTTERFVEELARQLDGVPVPDQPGLPEAWRALLDRTRQELDEYFAGQRRAFDLPVDLRRVSEWDRRVLGAAQRLGFGQVTSYGGLARAIGRPRAARAVGGALGRNPIPLVVPCHRIIASDGSLGGYGGGGHGSRTALLTVKRTLLALEGVSLPTRPGG